MAIIACRCPHCGGEVNMDENLESGFCVYCGNRVINDQVSKVKVSVDRSSEVVNSLRLAKSCIYDKDLVMAQSLLAKVMQVDSGNSDVWYMAAVLDPKNRKRDIARARNYRSLGIFTEDDMNSFNGLVRSERFKVAYMILFVFGFMAIFATIPIMFIFEIYWLTPLMIGIVLAIALVIFFIIRGMSQPVEDPTLKEAHDAALNSVLDSEERKRM